MRILETYFWVFLVAAFAGGVVLPFPGLLLQPAVIPAIMLMTFLAFSKVEISAVGQYLHRPLMLAYLLLTQLVLIPVVTFAIVHVLTPPLAPGFLLLAAVPPALVSVVLTDLARGDTALSLALNVLAYAMAPLSITWLLHTLAGTTVAIDPWRLLPQLLLMILVPLGLSQTVRRLNGAVAERLTCLANPINSLLIAFTIYIVAATQSQEIRSAPMAMLPKLLWLYGLFAFLYFAGHLLAFGRTAPEKIAICVTKTYMNNGLAIALAVSFFDAETSLVAVLSEVPWATTLGSFRYLQRQLL